MQIFPKRLRDVEDDLQKPVEEVDPKLKLARLEDEVETLFEAFRVVTKRLKERYDHLETLANLFSVDEDGSMYVDDVLDIEARALIDKYRKV